MAQEISSFDDTTRCYYHRHTEVNKAGKGAVIMKLILYLLIIYPF